MRVSFIVMSLLVACDNNPAGSAPPTPAPVPAVVQPPSPPAGELHETTHTAYFVGDNVDSCVDVETVVTHASPGLTQERLHDIAASTQAANTEALVLRVPCREQFTDRTPIASCSLERAGAPAKNGQLVTIRTSFLYYRTQTVVDSDSHMRACIRDGGRWIASAPDSPEMEQADLRANNEDLRHSEQELRRLSGQR